MHFLRILITLSLVMLVPSPSHAYLDPGTGSMVLQIILGGIAGIGLLGRIFWRKLRTVIFNKDKIQSETDQ